jgi:hypothetical protein
MVRYAILDESKQFEVPKAHEITQARWFRLGQLSGMRHAMHVVEQLVQQNEETGHVG